ncbi:MAG: accessory factor UbiK family protein, partial [Alphaproteobacteria bacterium]
VEDAMRARFDRWLAGLDLVRRDEFEAVKAMAAKARAENEALAARVEKLEAAHAAKPKARAARGAKAQTPKAAKD